MSAFLPDWPGLAAFLTASLLLALAPGPGVLYIVANSLGHGLRAGLASVAGVAVGNLGNAVGAVLGLALLFSIAPASALVVGHVGAAYLVLLGLRTLRGAHAQRGGRTGRPIRSFFLDGAAVALLNPKTALFFAAFLPQFTGGDALSPARGITLGIIFVAIAALTDAGYAVAAGGIAARLDARPALRRHGRFLSGATLIGIGCYTVLAGLWG